MKNTLPILAAAISMIIISCGISKKTTRVEYKTLEPVTVSANNNPIDIYRSSRPRYWDIIHTRVALSFDLHDRTANGAAWILLHPYFYTTDSLLLDAKSMDIESVAALNNGSYFPVDYTYSEDKLHIRLGHKYTREENVELLIKYTAKPYAAPTGGSKAITDDRGLYFINTDNNVPGKPMQIWTQGETESNSHWLPTIDQPNERMTVQLELTVPDSFKTLGNGALIRSETKVKGLRTDTWSIQQPIQVYAIMFAIGNFSIVKDKTWNGVEVGYYVEPQFAPFAKKMFNNTPEMIEYFSKITGVKYPWNKYSQVVVRDYVSGAMENTTASLFGEFMNQNSREIADKNYEDVVSHELFHQWFGDYVTAESWSNLTVNESFANYGEQLWRLYKYGKASNDELAYNDLAKYLNQTENNDEPLVRFHYGDKEEMFDRISYEKGGAILRYIHGLIGDDAFYKAMNLYLTKNALQPAEAHNWRMAIEEATGHDWNWFFNQWYYRGGHPNLNIQYEYDDNAQRLIVNVTQTPSDSGKAYLLPLKAALIDNNEKKAFDWVIDSKKQSFTYSYNNGVRPVFIPDCEHWLVGNIRENKKPAQWLEQMKGADDYINKRRALSNTIQVKNDTATKRIFHDALNDKMEAILVFALALLERMSENNDWKMDFKEEVGMLAVNGKSNRIRAGAFDVAGKWKITSLKNEMIDAISDSSYRVAGAALNALRILNKDTAYVIAKDVLKRDPKADLEGAAWNVIANKGSEDDIVLFERKAGYVYGTQKLLFASYLNQYDINTTSERSFEKGLGILTELTNKESIKSYRFVLGSLVFGASNYYKEQISVAINADKATEFRKRQEIAERYKQIVLSQEADPENLKRYKSL